MKEIILYRTGGYKKLITEVIATKVTDKSYWEITTDFRNNKVERRSSRFSNYTNVWSTKDEAKQYLKDKFNRIISSCELKISESKSNLEELDKL
jgi:hypothetical protein